MSCKQQNCDTMLDSAPDFRCGFAERAPQGDACSANKRAFAATSGNLWHAFLIRTLAGCAVALALQPLAKAGMTPADVAAKIAAMRALSDTSGMRRAAG